MKSRERGGKSHGLEADLGGEGGDEEALLGGGGGLVLRW